ncbi:MAG: metal-dependent transcriptional regulator [Bacteroidota bacterium]
MNTLTEENYLKALFSLSAESGNITVARLSKRMGVKMPTVTSMMKKLARKKMVQYTKYRPLLLTEKGRREALLIIRRHRLVEMFLVKTMNYGWDEVHDLAEQIEHIEAPEFFDRIDRLLNHPEIDPHGEPIPDRSGRLAATPYATLNGCRPGDTVRVRAVTDSSNGFLQYLNKRGLRLGARVRVKAVEPFDGSMLVSYGTRRSETLAHTVCEKLLVERV